MKRSDLDKDIKEKLLFESKSGEGKTFLSMNIAKIYAMNGKKVLYIDPEGGTDKDKGVIFGSLDEDELGKIELIKATNIETYLKYMFGWTEEKQVGSQTVRFEHGIDYDLKVCDGLTTEIELYKTRLTQKFIKQGYYEIGGSRFVISNPEIFMLPYQFYGKLYDQIKEALVVMIDHKYDMVATLHPLKDTESQKDLEQSIYQKFDSVVKLNKIILPNGNPKWNATVVKNRGRESPNKSNILENTDSLLTYFMKKFNMNIDETWKKFKYHQEV